MSEWDQFDLETKVLEALASVHCQNDEHAFGRPFITAYQLAIEIQAVHPGTVHAMGRNLGGEGEGRSTFAWYLAHQLSIRIAANDTYPVEGAFLANSRAHEIAYKDASGGIHRSSGVTSGLDTSMFRLRA